MISSKTSSGAESRIRDWIDDKDRSILERESITKKDVAYCLNLLQHTCELVITSYGVNRSSTEPQNQKLSQGLQEQSIDFSLQSQSIESKNPTKQPSLEFVPAIQGRFTDPKWIGTGAFGVIFSVLDKQLGIRVAIKILRPSKSHSIETRTRFFGEAKTTAELNHPSIIRIYDTGKIGALPYITSALSYQGSLSSYLNLRDEPIPPRQCAWFISKISDAVQYAHSSLTLHRDLKPGNILLFPEVDGRNEGFGYEPVLTDFGLSKRLELPEEKNLTLEGGVLGTLRYMSPEQAQGFTDQIRTTSDVYSLGVILYEMLTKKVPFDDLDDGLIRTQIVHATPIPPSKLQSGISKDLDAIVLKCLSKSPEIRYQTALELSADLQRYLSGDNVIARQSNWIRNVIRAIKRYPVVATLIFLIVAISTFTAISTYKARLHEKELTDWALRNSARVGSAFGDRILEGARITPSALLEILEPEIEALDKQAASKNASDGVLKTLSILRHYASLSHEYKSEHEQALENRRKVVKLQMELLKRNPKDTSLLFQLANSYLWIGIITVDFLQDPKLALTELEKANQLIQTLLELSPENVDAADLGNAITIHAGRCWETQKCFDEAIRCYNLASYQATSLHAHNSTRPMLLIHAISGIRGIANIQVQLGQIEHADSSYHLVIDKALTAFETHWEQGWTVRETLHTFGPTVAFEIKHKRYQKAIDCLDRWEKWFLPIADYLSTDPTAYCRSKEACMSVIHACRRFACSKLGDDKQSQKSETKLVAELAKLMSRSNELEGVVEYLKEMGIDIQDAIDLSRDDH
jgi:serine/threonine protein kinase